MSGNVLVECIVLREMIFFKVKPKIYDPDDTFVHCFLLGGVAYGEADLLVLS
jgi:hypothetical protein